MKRKQRIICGMMSILFLFSSPSITYAANMDLLNEVEEKINNLSQAQMEVQSEIDSLNADMVDLMIQINTAEQDLADIEEEIIVKEGEIEETQENLSNAIDTRDQQYEDMKKRIQFIYENGGNTGIIVTILESENIVNILNKTEYATQVRSIDQDMMDEYIATVQEIEELETLLEEQKSDLDEQKVDLENQKTALEENQEELQNKIEVKEAESVSYENEIAEAQAQAAQISSLIQQQEEAIRAAEEARAAANEAAIKAEEITKENEESNIIESSIDSSVEEYNNNDVDTVDADDEFYEDISIPEEEIISVIEKAESLAEIAEEAEKAAEEVVAATEEAIEIETEVEVTEEDNSSNSDSSGLWDVVSYADQWVGNSYVWGGNSLTDGIDCSHFVWQVLKNTGHYSGGYATSSGWRTRGTAVDSLSEAKAGDVICYSGHVAIYDGNGMIIEAKGSQWGITHDRSVNCATILAIRRFP